ncbi:hypothetical protein [Bacillus songklensis]
MLKIDDEEEEHKIRFPGEAIAHICKEHKEGKSNAWSLKYISEVVTKNIQEVFKDELTKIRLGANSADKNTQILIELMNGLFFHYSINGLITTSIQEMDGVTTAKEEVKKRIAHQRQKRID